MNEKEFIDKIFKNIGTTNKVAVEFGCHTDHRLSVCKHLIEKGWDVKFYGLEGGKGIYQYFITAENINEIFKKTKVPIKIDLMSIDIDGMDYWVWKAIECVKPRVVIIEYNKRREKGVQPYYAHNHWNMKEDNYYGASKEELSKLGLLKGYEIYDYNDDNLFFVEK